MLLLIFVFSLFVVAVSNPCGFVQVSSSNPRMFSISSGRRESLFFPVGVNDWYCNNPEDCLFLSAERLNAYFQVMRSHGINTFRLLADGGPESRVEEPIGTVTQGFINAMNTIVAAAEANGIYLVFSFLPTMLDGFNWPTHPYNIANGGFVNTVDDMLTDMPAIEAFKNRASFIAEHWGMSPNILTWEIWNEMNNQGTAVSRAFWLSQIGPHLKQREMELYGCYHLRSASVNNALAANDEIMSHPDLDFTSFHSFDMIHPEGAGAYDGVPGFSRVNPLGYLRLIYAESRIALRLSPGRPVQGTEDAAMIYDHTLPPMTLYFAGYGYRKYDDFYLGTLWASFVGGGAGTNLRWGSNHLYGEDMNCIEGNPDTTCPAATCGDNCGYRALTNGQYDYALATSLISTQDRFEFFLDEWGTVPWNASTGDYHVWGISTSNYSATAVFIVDRLNDLDYVPMSRISDVRIVVPVNVEMKTAQVGLFDIRTGVALFDEIVKVDKDRHEIILPTSSLASVRTFALAVITPKPGLSASVIAVAVILPALAVMALVAAVITVIAVVVLRRRKNAVGKQREGNTGGESKLEEFLTEGDRQDDEEKKSDDSSSSD